MSTVPSLFDLTGKTALVTGSSRGIGRAIAVELARHGARVTISSRKVDACHEVVAEIQAEGGNAIAIGANINDKAQLQALVDGTVAAHGPVDILVCNAAVNPYYGPISGIADEGWDRIMNANVRSNLWLCQMVGPAMAARGDGSIIFLSSIAGLRGSAMIGAYGVSKAADMHLARNLALEWGKQGVRVNTIAPGLVKTDFAKALWDDPATLKSVLAASPLGRIGDPRDIAGAAVFLASKAGTFVTGETIVVDGGATIGGSL
jgi:NAD(P)-dependent dehydrogenase (short-subunit alcohol dehydrogenase family)